MQVKKNVYARIRVFALQRGIFVYDVYIHLNVRCNNDQKVKRVNTIAASQIYFVYTVHTHKLTHFIHTITLLRDSRRRRRPVIILQRG